MSSETEEFPAILCNHPALTEIHSHFKPRGPPPTPCSAKKKKPPTQEPKKKGKNKKREDNPHQRCTHDGAGLAEHEVPGPSSISDVTWRRLREVRDIVGGFSACVFAAALLHHHLSPCASCSVTV